VKKISLDAKRMKTKVNKIKIVGLLNLVILCFGFNFGTAATAQENQRERAIEFSSPTQTPTPKPPVAPQIIPTPTPTPISSQTAADLQSRIRTILARPDLRRGSVGVKIVSLDANKTIFEENAEKYFMPASNMKSYTIAAALEKLSPNFKFTTSVFAYSMPDENGTLRGDLTVYGRGDISFSTAFYDGDYYTGLNVLAEKIVQAGVKRIEGNLVGDESYFTGNPIPQSWEWDDLQWYYGAEISALPINDNAVDLKIKPGAINSPCAVQILPANTLMKIVNRCVTVAAGAKRDVQVVKKLEQNILEIDGAMPLLDKGFEGYVTVSRPAQLFVELLRGLLIQKGVTITGQNKVINAKDKSILAVPSLSVPIEIAKNDSPPFSVIAAKTMKPSQNTYTETILWTLGEQLGRKQELASNTTANSAKNLRQTPSAELGLKVVREFLSQAGISEDSVIQWDGSGLSRHNLITPASAVQLYTYMSKSRYAGVWRDSLTIGATDGTLRNRFKGTAASGNVRGKTGTIDQVSSLSGYVTTAAGEKLVFSILVNGVSNVRARQSAIDEIVVTLAKFSGSLQ